MLRIYNLILITFLSLFIGSTISYALPNKWCSNGMNDKNVLPSPKPSFNQCPKNARTEMSLKEVENYYLSGGGQEYLCNLAKNPLFFGLTQKKYKTLKDIFVFKQGIVTETCNKFFNEKKIKAELVKKNQDKNKLPKSPNIPKLEKEKVTKQLKQKELTKKKEKQNFSKNTLSKIKKEAPFVVEVLKEYVQIDNDLDILEVGDLLNSYTNQVKKGWSDKTVSSYDKLYKYASSDKNFIKYLNKKKTEQKEKYDREVLQLKSELKSSQKLLSNFIKKNLGTDEANSALELAKKAKSILKKFNYKKAIELKSKISKWKSRNGIATNDKKEKIKIKEVANNSNKNLKSIEKEKRKTKETKFKDKNVSSIKKEKGKYPEFLREKFWFINKNSKEDEYPNGKKCDYILDISENEHVIFYKFTNVKGKNLDETWIMNRDDDPKNNYSIKKWRNSFFARKGYTRYSNSDEKNEIVNYQIIGSKNDVQQNRETFTLTNTFIYNEEKEQLYLKSSKEEITHKGIKDPRNEKYRNLLDLKLHGTYNWCSGGMYEVDYGRFYNEKEREITKARKSGLLHLRTKNEKFKFEKCDGTRFTEYGINKEWEEMLRRKKEKKTKCIWKEITNRSVIKRNKNLGIEILCIYENEDIYKMPSSIYIDKGGCPPYLILESTEASRSIRSSKALNTSPIVNEGDDGTFEKEYKERKRKKSGQGILPCKPLGMGEDALDKLMKNSGLKHVKCEYASIGGRYYEPMKLGMETRIICHYSEGKSMTMARTLYRSHGCALYMSNSKSKK